MRRTEDCEIAVGVLDSRRVIVTSGDVVFHRWLRMLLDQTKINKHNPTPERTNSSTKTPKIQSVQSALEGRYKDKV